MTRLVSRTAAGIAVLATAMLLGMAPLPGGSEAWAQEQQAAPEFSKEFRKRAGKVQKLVNDGKWQEVLAALPELEAIEGKTFDDRKVIAGWQLSAMQALGDREGLAATIEMFLEEGLASAEQTGPMHQMLAAHYNNKQDREKTLYHYRAFIDAADDVEAKEYETMARLYMQAGEFRQAEQWLGRVIDLATRQGTRPEEVWYQLRDRAYVELDDQPGRLANLEDLVALYPDKEYYSRIVAMYQQNSNDDRTVMLNAYRLAVTDPQGGLATVGGYLNYADTALLAGSPGEAARALERGMREGIVPSAGTNQASLQEAKAAVAADRRNLPSDEASAAKSTRGEVDVKIGLGYYSAGNYQKTVELVRRGLAKGGVSRQDDANLLLGAALVELGRHEDARAAFQAAAAAGGGNHLARIARLWQARVDRAAGPAEAAPAAPPAGT